MLYIRKYFVVGSEQIVFRSVHSGTLKRRGHLSSSHLLHAIGEMRKWILDCSAHGPSAPKYFEYYELTNISALNYVPNFKRTV